MSAARILFKGQRTARRGHFCDLCGREICRGEHYMCKVVLHVYERCREVLVQKHCCRGIR